MKIFFFSIEKNKPKKKKGFGSEVAGKKVGHNAPLSHLVLKKNAFRISLFHTSSETNLFFYLGLSHIWYICYLLKISYHCYLLTSRILDILIYFRIRHSFAHLRLVILSADWSIRRLQSWTSSGLPTVAEFVKLTQKIVIEIQRQSADLYKVQLCNRQFLWVSQRFTW